jgi:hypothetical protein
MIECGLAVSKIADTKNEKDRTFTVVLKGQKTVVHDAGGGYEFEDVAEISLTVKCGMSETVKKLGVSEPGMMKLMSLRGRDASLQSFAEMEPVAAAQRGIV